MFHMKLFIGAKAIIVNEGRILVLREASYDEGTNEGKWDVPGGRINPEEPIIEGLKREVMEESGLQIEAGEVLGVYETFPTIKGEACHIVRVYYQAKLISPDEVTLSGDHDLYEWIDPKTVTDKVFVSDILVVIKRLSNNSHQSI
jgi:8-oxo-dGTP diphosphatase